MVETVTIGGAGGVGAPHEVFGNARLGARGGGAGGTARGGRAPARRGGGGPVPDELLAHVAPLGWEHIPLTGDYDWVAASPPPGGFRPLRDVRAAFPPLAA